MPATASKKATGFVNNIKVTCSKCGSQLYVNPNALKQNSGKWKCEVCNATH